MSGPAIVVARSVPEACRLLSESEDDAKVISGGTAVVLMMRQGLIAPETLISVGDIAELQGIEVTPNGLRIGAASTLADLAASPIVRTAAPSLASACATVGNQRVRNVATIGGNIAEADYASDPPAALASLGASCHIEGPSGRRTESVADLITGFYETGLRPGELIVGIDIPRSPHRRHATYLKFRTRSSEDRSCVGVAACADVDGGAVVRLEVVVGAVAARLQRFPELLQQAAGRALDSTTIQAVADGYAARIRPLDDARGSAAYRTRVIAVLVRRVLQDLAGRAAAESGVPHE